MNTELLFDAEEYWSTGECPWTFFAYPTSLAEEHGLPPHEGARRLLGKVQSSGIAVAVWASGRLANNTTYFACRKDDVPQLNEILQELESSGFLGEGDLLKWSDELFAAADLTRSRRSTD